MDEKKGFKVLIVDDDDVIRDTYVQIFKSRGAEVISAKDGVEGIDFATKELPDAIMTGIIMPRMDGFQLVKTLKDNVQTRDIPIVILSHLGREEDRKKAEELGVDNFIVQGSVPPFEIVDLVHNMTKASGSYLVEFDFSALGAPRLAKTLPRKNFFCPSCREKMIIELATKKEGGGYDAVIKCPKCGAMP